MNNEAVGKILAPFEVGKHENTAENLALRHDVSRETQKLCRCGSAARPGEYDCLHCHAAAQKIYRARQIYRRKQAMSAHFGDLAQKIRLP